MFNSCIKPGFKFSICIYILYAVFVIAIAFIRRDFLWITHDDANLLQQSILITNGFIPNVDYFSGYPGLSLYVQSMLIKLFGPLPFVQHLYSALLQLVLGIIFFWIGRKYDPIIVFVMLVFSYTQSLWLNPTPNPGYLFDLFFIFGMLMTYDYFSTFRKLTVISAGVFFGLGFCSKQYGIFGPVAFFIGSIALLNVNLQFKRLFTAFVCFIAILFIVLSYTKYGILSIVASNTSSVIESSSSDLFRNALLFMIPVLFVVFKLSSKLDVQTRVLSVGTFFRANTLCAVSFVVTVYLVFLAQYGPSEIVDVFYQILIAAPRRINEHVVPVSLNLYSTIKTLLGLAVVCICMWLFRMNSRPIYEIISVVLFALLVLFFYIDVNLSATVFVPVLFVLIAIYYVNSKSAMRYVMFAMILGIAPILMLLIPYPKPTYHIPLLFTLLLLNPEQQIISASAIICRRFILILVSAFVVIVLINLKSRIDSYPSYNFFALTFKTEDRKWEKSISEAYLVMNSTNRCATYGCRYLLMTHPSFAEFLRILEKRDSKDPFE